jgi:multidrug efflux pump
MTISDLSIKRPILALVLSIAIVLFGLVGYFSLGIREYPSVDPAVITCTTTYTGANADVIESQITEPLEDNINQVAGIKTMKSVSSDGQSSITIEFNLGVDMETAANDVRDKVSQAVRNLPPDANPPIVTKADADAETVFSVTLQSSQRNLLELTDIGNNIFKERLQTIPGVSQVNILGERKYAMRLVLDPKKMEAYNLTPTDISNALTAQNIELPTGIIDGKATELTVRALGRISTPDEFNNLIIAQRNGTLIKLKDVGNAVLGAQNERTILRGNGGIPMIGVALTTQPGANYIQIVDEAYRRIEKIKKDIPKDIQLSIALDNTKTIRKAISEVFETIFIAFGLVILVVFFFLRNWRATLIPIVTVPISLIGSFFFLYVMGFSINILTLLGLVLGTGLVVDDAIVVLENIYKKIEEGQEPIQAAFKGAREVFFAVVSTSITLISVFLPIFFLQGFTGKLFREFAMVIGSSILISTFVSLSLSPMMSSRILHKGHSNSELFKIVEAFINSAIRTYNRALTYFINHRWFVFPIIIFAFLIIYFIGTSLPSELAPIEDKSMLRIVSTAPEGTSYEAMDNFQKKLTAIVDTIPEREHIIALTAPGFGSALAANNGFIRISLVDPNKRKRSQAQIAQELMRIVNKYNFAQSYIVQEPTIAASQSSKGALPIQFVLQATSLDKLKTYLPKFLKEAQSDPVFDVVTTDLKFNKPELIINIDRDKALDMGVSVADIAAVLQLYLAEQRIGYFIKDGKQYYVISKADDKETSDPTDLRMLTVKNSKGEMVKLDNLVRFAYQSRPPQLLRFNRYVSATISASPAPGKTLGDGINEMNLIASKVLDETFTTSLTGSSADFSESSGNLYITFLFTLILVFLTLSAQFESFRDPFVIMFTVPLAISGALLSLFIFGQTLNIFSEIGMIVLVGIVTKNGILIIEFANQRREQGLSINEAIIDAATQRFRPIVMTSLATILGALPIALALGEASTSRVPMGISIIGGLLFSLILTLFVIPSLYTYVTSKKEKKYVEEEL